MYKIQERYISSGRFYNNLGTMDFSPYMSIPAALKFRSDAGGEEAIMQYNHNLAYLGGQLLAAKFKTQVLQDKNQIGSMVDVRLPVDNTDDPKLTNSWWVDEQLTKYPRTFAPVYKHNGSFWTRVSAQIYNDITDFDVLAQQFVAICNELNSQNSSHNLTSDNSVLSHHSNLFRN